MFKCRFFRNKVISCVQRMIGESKLENDFGIIWRFGENGKERLYNLIVRKIFQHIDVPRGYDFTAMFIKSLVCFLTI